VTAHWNIPQSQKLGSLFPASPHGGQLLRGRLGLRHRSRFPGKNSKQLFVRVSLCRPGHRCHLTLRTGPAGGINNSGCGCVAAAASEDLKLACIAVGGIRRSSAQVPVLATYGADHTIVEAEHWTAEHRRCALRRARASTAFTTGVRRAIGGTLLIEIAHIILPSAQRVPEQGTGREVKPLP
jgi:hypothetical protein